MELLLVNCRLAGACTIDGRVRVRVRVRVTIHACGGSDGGEAGV